MAKQQKSFIIKHPGSSALSKQQSNIEELNALLNDGWRVFQTCPMSAPNSNFCYALVIIEKED
ncbi:MAG: hypothetical protein K0R54_176 [Clostridiaceae bacterium]|jgi:hypothetical protein|nr:hypothetical protein [Clostridiaceae bacterium]